MTATYPLLHLRCSITGCDISIRGTFGQTLASRMHPMRVKEIKILARGPRQEIRFEASAERFEAETLGEFRYELSERWLTDASSACFR